MSWVVDYLNVQVMYMNILYAECSEVPPVELNWRTSTVVFRTDGVMRSMRSVLADGLVTNGGDVLRDGVLFSFFQP